MSAFEDEGPLSIDVSGVTTDEERARAADRLPSPEPANDSPPRTTRRPRTTAPRSVASTRPTSRRFTDVGNAERFVDQHADRVRACFGLGRLAYDGKRWARDLTNEWMRRAIETVRSIYGEAANADDPDRRKACSDWARKSESRARLEALAAIAEAHEQIAITPEALDRDPFLFNVENGTIDLRTGTVRDHDRADLITRIAGTSFNISATAPTWDRFLRRIFADDEDLIGFVQRFMGYTLTADVGAQVLFFAHGGGQNGKSTLIETWLALLGDYGRPAAPGLLLVKKHEGHPTELADLMGARLACCVEIGEGKRLDEERTKALTGGDTIKARYMAQDFFSFKPTHKLVLCANHKPEIRGTDRAIWRRILLVPFDVTIPDAEKDPHLLAKLRAELPGILAWAVRGCLDWQARGAGEGGLGVPAKVRAATDAFRDEQNVVGRWIADECVTMPQASGKASALYASFAKWCDGGGEDTPTLKAFSAVLEGLGFRSKRVTNGVFFHGLGLRAPPESPRDEGS